MNGTSRSDSIILRRARYSTRSGGGTVAIQGVTVKSLLSRKGTLLDNAPSFLLRQKSSGPIRFAATEMPEDATDDVPDKPSAKPPVKSPAARAQPGSRVTPLRAVMPSMPQTGAHPLQTAQIAEVEWLAQQSSLTTFRSFNSFAFTASMLFHPRDLTYYAVLYHEGAVWRVLKALDLDSAEPAFHHFVEQAMRLAEAELRRVHLEAQNDQLARMIAESDAQVERVRVDLQRGSSQDQEVALKQQETRKQLAQLEARRVASQVQLTKLQRQLHQLDATSNEAIPHLPSSR
jgi:hypothetical protein